MLHTFLFLFINIVYRSDENCYLLALLEECKYKFKQKTVKRFNIEDLTASDSFSETEDQSNNEVE